LPFTRKHFYERNLAMQNQKFFVTLVLLLSSQFCFADTPASLINGYSVEAAKSAPGFKASAQRGQAIFTKEWGVSQKMPNCTVCHSKNLKVPGKHVVTDKVIEPLSPTVNPERFTSLKKVEKWFKRNCTEVVGRDCTDAEKADFIQFVSQ
jgi:hypothetical protein